MKCEHCGNNLSLEDKVCPYCGKENTLAQKHNKDMAKFEKDYAVVKNEVLTNSRRLNGLTVRITVIAVLVALIAALILCIGGSFDIRSAREERMIRAHLNEHKANIESFMDSKNYLGLYYYFQANRLAYSESLEDYYMAYSASSCYNQMLEYFGYLLHEDSYVSDEEAMERIAGTMERFAEMKDPKSDFEKKKYYKNADVVAYINNITEHSETLIKGYFGLSDEEIKEFETLSKARKQVMLEEGWKNGKQ
ncbi:MAG: zinc ribbon domain-containing protein [Lachnospiraceae bacterium]|nr:zinc ribbon domain-containing protein [Lachnospiraceae bacterium]